MWVDEVYYGLAVGEEVRVGDVDLDEVPGPAGADLL